MCLLFFICAIDQRNTHLSALEVDVVNPDCNFITDFSVPHPDIDRTRTWQKAFDSRMEAHKKSDGSDFSDPPEASLTQLCTCKFNERVDSKVFNGKRDIISVGVETHEDDCDFFPDASDLRWMIYSFP